LAENSARSEQFKGIYQSWRDFRGDQVAWFGVTELSFDTLMTTLDREGRL
jgi:TRAP-type mannitol/chloroaromatic compound transport system substrate-binding protein